MKKTYLLPAIVSSLFLPAETVHATDYSAWITVAEANWDNLPWTPASPLPGALDDVLDVSRQPDEGGNVSNTNVYFNSPTIDLKSLGKTNEGTVRFYSGSTSTPGDTTLNISGLLSVSKGGFRFRGDSASTRLTINAGDILVNNGSIYLGESEAFQNVTLNVARTTVLTGTTPVIQVGGSSVEDAATYASFGHVIFRDIASTGASGINIGKPGMVTEIKGLRTEGEVYASAAISGSGTLIISGTLGDPNEPAGENRFASSINSAVRVVKTGNNIQILARSRGNVYSGGTEITGGILAVANTRNNESGIGSGAATVKNGGTLASDGFGSVRPGDGQTVTVESGGNVAAGALQRETFSRLAFNGSANGTAPILEMQAGATFTFRLGEGNLNDQIFFLGYAGADDLVLNNTVVNFTGDISEGVYDLFVFKSNESTNTNVDALSSIASGLTGGLVIGSGLDGFEGIFHYDDPLYGGTGVISLELTAVPEPQLMIPALLAGGALLITRRRRMA